MNFTDKDLKRFMVLAIVLFLIVTGFFLVKPILLSIIGGLILAYIFYPVYTFILKYLRERNTVAALVSIIAVLIIFIPLWFIVPIMINQTFEISVAAQNFEVQGAIQQIFPSASEKFVIQTSLAIKNAISETTKSILQGLIDQSFNNLSTIFLKIFIVAIVFFFALRDADHLGEFMSSISPLNKIQEALMVKHFKDITDSLIYGNIIVGILQGLMAGLGFFLFGIPNTLFLTVVAIIFGIIPVLGPILVWGPLTLYLLASGETTIAILFLIYNAILVSGFENVLRPYIVSRKSNVPTSIVFIGMVGGTFLFGFIGLIIGPLLLAYILELLRAYRNKTLASLFS